jgi:hypothetical protein
MPIELATTQLQRLANGLAEYLLFKTAQTAVGITAREVWVGTSV